MALPVAQIMAQIQEGVSDVVVAEAEEKADEAEDMVATSVTCSFSRSELAGHAPCAESANLNVKIIGASQKMCSYLHLLHKLPAALVIRKVKLGTGSGEGSYKCNACYFVYSFVYLFHILVARAARRKFSFGFILHTCLSI